MTHGAGPAEVGPEDEAAKPQDGSVATLASSRAGADPAPGQSGSGGRRKKAVTRAPGEKRWIAAVFLFPAAVFLAAIVFYPLIYTLVRSFFKDGPGGATNGFAGFKNYTDIFTTSDAFRSLKNNLIWLLIVPVLITVLGLMFAVLTERIRWAAAFKLVVFMPMAISSLASGITWALIYVDQPSQGLGNALVTTVHDTFVSNSGFPNLHPSDATVLTGSGDSGYTSNSTFATGSPALVPMTGLDLQNPPGSAVQAKAPTSTDGLSGVVWNDFKLGGAGTKGQIDPGEIGVPGIKVQAVQDGKVVATATTKDDGSFSFSGIDSGSYTLKLPSSDFHAKYNGISWLGKNLITFSIIISYIWIFAGFAMTLLAAGMSAIPRDALEAARMDGATEWQVFRRVTVPLLMPVVLVVFVTMVINVLKIFDIVYVIQQSAGGNAKYANVLATQLYSNYGQQSYGAASAVGIVLVILVIPAMIFQVHQFRKGQR
jgi:ABC-type sugar transport system permease subunit